MADTVPVDVLLRFFSGQCDSLGSPFYAALLLDLADDFQAGGPTATVLTPHAWRPGGDAVPLRLLGGVHRLVLEGAAPELAVHFPSVGGDGDATATWPVLRAFLEERAAELDGPLSRPPQTNEVGRSVGLVGGMLVMAAETGLPLRLLELGSSAALNLRLDRYWYEAAGTGFGDPASGVRFVDRYAGGVPPLGAGIIVAERRGCDRDPIDAATDDGRLTLLSYVWPDQTARFELLRGALDVARDFPVAVDRDDITRWLRERLRDPVEGVATVVFHSIVWQYLDDAERAEVVGTFTEAGARATAGAPLAWLRLEGTPDLHHAEVRLTTWPGGEERLLATTGFHGGAVEWLA